MILEFDIEVTRTSLLKVCRSVGVVELAVTKCISWVGRRSGKRDPDMKYVYPCLIAACVQLKMFGDGQHKHDYFHRWFSRHTPLQVTDTQMRVFPRIESD